MPSKDSGSLHKQSFPQSRQVLRLIQERILRLGCWDWIHLESLRIKTLPGPQQCKLVAGHCPIGPMH